MHFTRVLDPHYFESIDSPLKGYILGFLAADGNVSDGNVITLELHEKDAAAVEIVQAAIAPLSPLRRRVNGAARSPRVRFRVQSIALAAGLARYGVVPRKSLTLDWPHALPPEYEPEFILGLFDGDGSLAMAPNRVGNIKPRWILDGQLPLLSAVRERFRLRLGVEISEPKAAKHARLWRIRADSHNAMAVDRWLHARVPGLARKRIPDGYDLVTRHRFLPNGGAQSGAGRKRATDILSRRTF